VQYGRCGGRILLQEVTQALGYRQHPLAHRLSGKHVIGEVGGELGHAPAIAGAADATAFTAESNQHIVTAARAPPASKAMGQDSTRQVLAELALDILGHGVEVQISLPGVRCQLSCPVSDNYLGRLVVAVL